MSPAEAKRYETAKRIDFNLSQLDEEQIIFCKAEARKLSRQQIFDDTGTHIITYMEWLDTISEQVRKDNEFWRGQYCAVMTD